MTTHVPIPIGLLEQFERGNVLLFVGEGINRGALPSSLELATELAARCNYPPDELLTLPRVAGFYEMIRRDRQGLVQYLREHLDQTQLRPLRAHELVAQLRPRVIVTTCYDNLLERALRAAGIPVTPVVGNAEIAYADDDKLLLVWLWGALDRPESLIVTADDRRLFLEHRANLSDVLRGELARRTWLFIGFEVEDEWFQSFYDSVNRNLDRHNRRSYIFGSAAGAYARAWWETRNAEIVGADVEAFLQALTAQLAERIRPGQSARSPLALERPQLLDEPYKALVSYEASDRLMFFGRKNEIDDLTALIHAHRLVLLYGSSGVGKSSLLQAGVIPRLEEAEADYMVITVRALTHPAAAIRAAVRRRLSETELPTGDTPLVDFLNAALQATGRRLLIVIDQFEEFFIRLSPEFRSEFIAELGAVYEAAELPVKIVLSLREDYLASMSELERRIPEVFRTRVRLLPLTRQQARESIVTPVEICGYTYENALVERLLDDLTREGVMPPQLQLVCNALFHHARAAARQLVSLADYDAVDGTKGVLRGYLEEELRHFPTDEKNLARDLMEELVTSERTKKVEALAELQLALETEPTVLQNVVDKLIKARLLRPVDLAEGSETAYELAHEYLISEIALSKETIARKETERLLAQEVDNWRRFGTLPSLEALMLIDEQRERLRLSEDAQELLLLSALRHGHQVAYWQGRISDSAHLISILTSSATSSFAATRLNVARAFGRLSSAESADLLLPLVVDKDPAVREAARASLVDLSHTHSTVVQAVLSGMRTADRMKRALLMEALASLPIANLPVKLQGQIIWTRARKKTVGVADRYIPNPVVRAGVLLSLVLLMLTGIVYWGAFNRYYTDVTYTSTDSSGRIVIKRGLPGLTLPGLNDVVVDTGLSLPMYSATNRTIFEKQLGRGWWQKLSANGYEKWGDDVVAPLGPLELAQAHWYLGERAETLRLVLDWTQTDIRDVALKMLSDLLLADPSLAPQVYTTTVEILGEPGGVPTQAILNVGHLVAADKNLTSKMIDALSRQLESNDAVVKTNAVRGLWKIASVYTETMPAIAASLLPVLGSQARVAKAEAIDALWQIGLRYADLAPRFVNEIVPLLDDPDPLVFHEAVGAFARLEIDDPGLAAKVVGKLQTLPSNLDYYNDYYIQENKLAALRKIVSTHPQLASQAAEVALPILSEPNSIHSTRSIALLAEIGAVADQSLVSQIAEVLTPYLAKDTYDYLRTDVVNAFVSTGSGSPEAAVRVISALAKVNWKTVDFTSAIAILKQLAITQPQAGLQSAEVLLAHFDPEIEVGRYPEIEATLTNMSVANKAVATQVIRAMLPISASAYISESGRFSVVTMLIKIAESQPEVVISMRDDLLFSADWPTRATGALMLGAVAHQSGKYAQTSYDLQRILTDTNQLVRVAAATALLAQEDIETSVMNQATQVLSDWIAQVGVDISSEALAYLNTVRLVRDLAAATNSASLLVSAVSYSEDFLASADEFTLTLMLTQTFGSDQSAVIPRLVQIGVTDAALAPHIIATLTSLMDEPTTNLEYIVAALVQIGTAHDELAATVASNLLARLDSAPSGVLLSQLIQLCKVNSSVTPLVMDRLVGLVRVQPWSGWLKYIAELGQEHPDVAPQALIELVTLANNSQYLAEYGQAESLADYLVQLGGSDAVLGAQAMTVLESWHTSENTNLREVARNALPQLMASQASSNNLSGLWKALADPLNNERRLMAGRALYLIASRDPFTAEVIQNGLRELAQRHEPHLRIAANRTLQMVSIDLSAWEDTRLFGDEIDWAVQHTLANNDQPENWAHP